jgi:hypothetical protein
VKIEPANQANWSGRDVCYYRKKEQQKEKFYFCPTIIVFQMGS